MLVGASEDGSYVYLVATGALAAGAARGQDNLYLMHEHDGGWTTTFIATLSREDEKDWRSGGNNAELSWIASRVSSHGRYLSFMSDRPLTGYDNRDAISGQPDEEVFLYDAGSNRLVCVSCDPTGTRPIGVHETQEHEFLVDGGKSWNGIEEQPDRPEGHWLSGVTAPAWDWPKKVASYQPRSLGDDGRMFFNSTDALVSQDTNGVTDVYEYEPSGVGTCANTSTTFTASTNGCVNLLSSGQSASESTFLDASEAGDDAFFITAARLSPEDYDTAFDVYDAHVCSSGVPCRAAPATPPPCTSGDSCKAAPSPQPSIFGAAPSATFSGAGNVVETPHAAAKTKQKSKRTRRKKRHPNRRRHGGRSRRARRSRGRTTIAREGRR
jgi:hypothetical protein